MKLDGIELEGGTAHRQYTSMTLLAGRLSGEAKVRYGAGKPTLQISSDVSVAGVHTIDNALHDDFVNWDRLELSGINFQRDPDRLVIEQVAARKLYARVIIEPDNSLNVKRVLAGPGATVIAPAPPGPPVAATAVSQAKPASGRNKVPAMPHGCQKDRAASGTGEFRRPVGDAKFRHRHPEPRGHRARVVVKSRFARQGGYPWLGG